MSSSDDGDDQGGAGRREVAYRLFAAEFEDADFSYSESDEERAPNYVVTPTGARVNRLFVVGVLTEVENASEDVLRARIVDPTGAFVVYAGQYQPDAQAFFERAETPSFVAVTGKARTFQPDDSDVTYTSVRPENVNEVDAGTRDRWTLQAARRTLARVSTMADALRLDERGDDLRRALEDRDVDVGLAAGVPLAIDHYGTTPAYLDAVRELAVSAAEVVAGQRDEVDPFNASPDAPGEADLAGLAAFDVPASVDGDGDDPAADAGQSEPETAASTGEPAESDVESTATTESATDADSTEESPSSAATEIRPDESADTATADATGASVDESAATTATESDDVGSDSAERGAATTESDATETATAAGEGETETETETTEAPTAETAAPTEATDADDFAEADGTVDEDTATGGDDLDDFDPGDFELDEEEREEIEEEFGTEFQSGTEVEPPGEADIDTPDPEPDAEPGAEPATASGPEASSDAGTEPSGAEAEAAVHETLESGATETDADDESVEPETGSAEAEPETADPEPETANPEPETAEPESAESTDAEPVEATDAEPAEDVDLDDAVMDAMEDLDDGDGAAEDDIVAAVTDRTGAGPDAVRDAIQDALMQGQCYEPDDGVFKPI